MCSSVSVETTYTMYTNILIIICMLSVGTLGRIEDVECHQQFARQSQLSDRCHNRLITANLFQNEFYTTIILFNAGEENNSSSVNAFFTKYCRLAPSILQCYGLLYDVSAECRLEITNRELKMIAYDIVDSLIDYVCENDADVLKKLLPHNGFGYFFLNDDFGRCIPDDSQFLDVGGFCLAVGSIIPCVEEKLSSHPNKDILVIAREVLNRVEKSAKCSN